MNAVASAGRIALGASGLPLATLQPEFSALAIEPLDNGILDLALERGIAVLAWSPLAQGRLGADSAGNGAGADPAAARVIAVLDAMAARSGVGRTVLACSWIMAHPARPIPLIGTQSPQRIRALAAACDVTWTRAEWYALLTAARGAPLP